MEWDGIITILILLGIGILVYCKIAGKTLTEAIKEIKDIFTPEND